jgi:hypothetical protein
MVCLADDARCDQHARRQKQKSKKKTLAQFFRKKNKEPEAVVFFVIGLLRLLCT